MPSDVKTKHPDYERLCDVWLKLDHAYAGEDEVKDHGTTYLPPTSGMVADGMGHNQDGYKAYQAYLMRSVFPEFMSDSVSTNMGMLWYRDPVITLPPEMEPLRRRASVKGETLTQLMRRVHEQQLIKGRVGLLLDLPEKPPEGQPVLPYIALYQAATIINWDDGGTASPTMQTLNMVVLDETEQRRDGFGWSLVPRHRVLKLGQIDENESTGVYSVDIHEGSSINSITPTWRGRTLDRVPFVFINSKDLLPEPDIPPLRSLANTCFTIYRGEADYRQNLFMQGQDTLVIIGAETDEGKTRVGANAVLSLPQGAEAKYIGVNSKGLAEQRSALENDKRLAASKSGQMVDTTSRQRESGDALQTRVAAQTATLNDIATTAAGGIEEILRAAATWMGLNPDDVSVKPNLDFINQAVSTRNIVELQTAKNLGTPVSQKTIHDIMRQRQYTGLTYEEEIALIKSETPLIEENSSGNEGGTGQAGTQGGSGRGAAGV